MEEEKEDELMRDGAGASPSIVAGAILSAVCARPLISQRYKVRVGSAKVVCKKISYTNIYTERRIFRFRTNSPQVIVRRCFMRSTLSLFSLGAKLMTFSRRQILTFRGPGVRDDGSWDLELAAGDTGFLSMRYAVIA